MSFKLTDPSIYRVSIKGVAIDGDKFLLTKEAASSDGKEYWTMLGGGYDFADESHEDCLRREIMEETGLEVTEISKSPFFTIRSYMKDVETHKLDVVYEIKLKDLNFTASDECQELKFFTLEEMKSLTMFDNGKELAQLLSEKVRP